MDEYFHHIEIDDPEIEIIISKVEELAPLIEKGICDVGITEKAFILDSGADVIELVDLNYGQRTWEGAKIVLAVSENSGIKSLKGLQGKKIATWLPKITEDYLKKHKVKANIEITNTPAEQKCPAIVDGVVEFVNTGAALKMFRLKVLDILMETSPWLIVNKESFKDKWKRKKIENLALLLKGARKGCGMVGLMLHASNDMMEKVLKILPSLKRPTVTHLRGQNWFSVFTIVDKKELIKLIPRLKRIGCTDIIEFSLRKVIP